CAYHFEKTNIPSKGAYGAHVKGEAANRLDHLVVRISRNKRSDTFEEFEEFEKSVGGRLASHPADSQAELGAKFGTKGGAKSGTKSGAKSGANGRTNSGTKSGTHFAASLGPNDEGAKRGKEYLLNELNEFVSVDRRGEEGGGTVKCSTQSEDPNASGQATPSGHSKQRGPPVGGDHDEEIKLERLLKKRQGIKKDIVTITEKAKEEIKKLVKEYRSKKDEDKNYVLKLFYIIKGCNGLTHSFNFVHRNELHANDELIFEDDCRKNILLAIDSKCILYVINTTLDYYRDDLTERFIFTNPNVTSVCPCGTSFHFNRGGG
ncbi:HesB-like domain containing protein, partial [Plasmodium cynomolgi strain B]